MENKGWVNTYDNIPMNQHDVHFYESTLGLSREAWKDKTILDLGAGQGGAFELELEKLGFDVKVFSLSRHYQDSINAQLAGSNPIFEEIGNDVKPKTVAGDALALPFKDESFDLVVSVMGVPFYLNTIEDYEQMLKEIKRVLKEGGEARLYPGFSKSAGLVSALYPKEEITKLLNQSGLDYENYDPDCSGKAATLILRKPKNTH